MTGNNVADHLVEAERPAAIVRRRTRWAVWSYIATGTTGFGLALVASLPKDHLAFQVGIAASIAIGIVAEVIRRLRRRRRMVERRGYEVRRDCVGGVWAAVWGLAVLVGSDAPFRGNLAYWIPAGAATALVMYIGAYLEYRAARR